MFEFDARRECCEEFFGRDAACEYVDICDLTDPTKDPTKNPNEGPSAKPTGNPTTENPTEKLSTSPTKTPIENLTQGPTYNPTATAPTYSPTSMPTATAPGEQEDTDAAGQPSTGGDETPSRDPTHEVSDFLVLCLHGV